MIVSLFTQPKVAFKQKLTISKFGMNTGINFAKTS